MGSWILSFKVFLISFGLVSFALGIKFSTSFIVQFTCNQASVIWSIVVSCLKPPYLYFTVNGIIITIIASLRNHIVTSEPLVLVDKAPPPVPYEIKTIVETPLPAYDSEDEIVELKPVLINGVKADFDQNEEETGDIDTEYESDGDDELDISSSACTPPQKIIHRKVQSESLLPEKPLVCSEFGHRSPNRANPEGE